jgi:hypothetical protein
MGTIRNLLEELDERTIAQKISIRHDQYRMSYDLKSNTVRTFDEFIRLDADYYAKHFIACVSHGGSLSTFEAGSRAKEILEKEYRRRGGDIVTAYNDAHDGINGGMRAILDIIAENLKAESVELYIRDVFDRYVAPNSWEQKVEIIRQFIDHCGVHLSSSIQTDQPERYASHYRELVQSYVAALQRTSSIFRRL